MRTWVANRPVFQVFFREPGLTELNELKMDAGIHPTSAQAPRERATQPATFKGLNQFKGPGTRFCDEPYNPQALIESNKSD